MEFDALNEVNDGVYTPTPLPEPGTLALVGLAAAGSAGWRRRGQSTFRPHHGPA